MPFAPPALAAAIERGWVLMPLAGKKPILTDWQLRTVPDLPTLTKWAAAGNLGLCAGQSGLLILDCDPRHGGQPHDLDLPECPTVETGGGGWHYYFAMPDPPIGNRAGFISGWDARGTGGQVVYPGSIHPDTGDEYRWLCNADMVPPPLPPGIRAMLCPTPTERRTALAAPSTPAGTNYARAAIDREMRNVAMAPEGRRNETLNTAAYNLGQLVAGGVIDRDTVVDSLSAAASSAGLDEKEIAKTIASGMRAGANQPRAPQPSARPARTSTPAVATADQSAAPHVVLIPGSHVDAAGIFLEIGTDDFASSVIAALPLGAIYRRSSIVGRVVGPQGARQFQSLTPSACRLVVDACCNVSKWVASKKSDDQSLIFLSCSSDLACLVLAAAATDPRIPEIALMTSYPVVTKHGISPAGFSHGVYYDEPIELTGLVPDARNARAILDDLVVDFPFATEADRQNFYGLLLTPILRPLTRNAPLHLVMASRPRTGKTKLIDEVLGGIILGASTPALQLSGSDEERDKRVLSALIRGDTIRHLDNVRDYLDSAVLASLLTAPVYSGRILSRSELVDLPNTLTLVASGNNIRATKEIVDRSVPIILQPATSDPSTRADFRHPELPRYVAENRRAVFAALLGLVTEWQAAGSRPGPHRLGGFEEWARIVGGVLAHAGMIDWHGNAREWRREADPDGSDMDALLDLWWRETRGSSRQAKEIAKLAEEAGLFPKCWLAPTDRGRHTSFARTVLCPNLNAPVGDGFVIRRWGTASNSLWRLENTSLKNSDPGQSTQGTEDF